VHLWLDEMAGKAPWGMWHRRVRHHAAGIEEVRHRWGDKAAAAARQHIEADLQQEGWNAKEPFPRNEQEYVRMGFF
jgi:DNA-binding GntR family transcriptional regulator